jgi:PadR family transcriptional regulator PadR
VSESLQVQLRKGVLEMCVLVMLAPEDGYAYDIASRLAEDIGMGEGTIYPLMRRMQSEGLVSTYLQESNSGPPRKYYQLTEKGRTVLNERITDWREFSSAVSKILARMKRPGAKILGVVK